MGLKMQAIATGGGSDVIFSATRHTYCKPDYRDGKGTYNPEFIRLEDLQAQQLIVEITTGRTGRKIKPNRCEIL